MRWLPLALLTACAYPIYITEYPDGGLPDFPACNEALAGGQMDVLGFHCTCFETSVSLRDGGLADVKYFWRCDGPSDGGVP